MDPIHRIRIPSEVVSFVSSLPPSIKKKVRAGLDSILKEPEIGKPLKLDLTGLRSLRIGRFRIVYRWASKIVEVVAIGPRISIYQDVSLKIKRLKKTTP